MSDNVQARVFHRLWADDFGMFLFREEQGKRQVAVRIEWEDRPLGAYDPAPTTALEHEAAQALMDDLWGSGVRPSRARHDEGTVKHLEDMRAIAFGKLNIEMPGRSK